MTPATYRRLIELATDLIDDGRRSTAVPIADRSDALTVVGERHAVLSALEAQVWALVGPGRAAGVRSALHPDAVEAAALRLADTITQTVGAERPHPSLIGAPQSAWGQAARAIRAATDLVSTHHDGIGLPRSPAAYTLASDDMRDAALARLATLALTAASVEDALALRVGQTGVPWTTVRRWLPGMQRVTLAARDLAHATGSHASRPLPDIGLVSADVRTDGGLVELTDRLARVRQSAWALVNSPDRSIATLRDLATIGVAVHAHAAAFHAGPTGPAATLIARGRRWQALGSNLAVLVSPAPHDDTVRADLVALARLLPALAPLSATGRADLADPALRRTGAALGGGVALMTEVADHSARTFAKITRGSAVYVPARALTGEEITDHPELVRARLDGRLAPASPRLLEEVGHLYGDLRSHPNPISAPGPVLGHDAPAQAVGIEAVAIQVDA